MDMRKKLSGVNLNDYKPLRKIIFDTLRDSIIVGDLKPGERLLEMQLAEEMGVSRTPVREAIRMLELEGLITMLPRKGAHVAHVSQKDIADVLEIRASLDGLATFLAADRRTAEDVKDLENVFEQFKHSVEKNNTQAIIKKDIEFHDIIYRASKNEKLIQILNNLKEQILRYRVIYIQDYNARLGLVKEHEDILRAIEKKACAEAQFLAQEHIKNQELKLGKSI